MSRLSTALAALLALPLVCAAAPQESGVWLKGDLHVHDDHSSDGSLPRQRSKDRAKGNVAVGDQIGQGEKMGLQFLALTDHRTFDQYFDPQWESSKLLLIPGEEANGSPHAIVLGAVDSVIQGADRSGFAHVQHSVWDAHAQGAAWSVAHPDDGEIDKTTFAPNIMANVQGVDLVETWNHASDVDREIDYAENRWNAGFRFGIAGASDNHFREYWDWQGPSLPTSSVLVAANNERGVIDGLKAGHTTLSWYSNGPAVTLTTDLAGARPATGGDEVFVRPGTRGHLTVSVQRAVGMKVLVYKSPGKSAGVFRAFTPTKDAESWTLDITSPAQADWYRVEIRRATPRDPTNARDIDLMAAASPLFISPGPVEARPETPVPADQGADDGASLAVGDLGQFTGFPDIASETGVLHLVAETHGPGASQVVYRHRDGRGAWSARKVLSGLALARFPRIAAHGRDVWVVWQEDAMQIPHRPVIRLAHSTDGGANWRPAQTIRSLDGRAEHPVIAIAASGKPVVAWQEIKSGEPFDILAQEIGTDAAPRNLTRPGKTFGPGSPDDTRSARYPASVWPAIAAAPDGRIAVAWEDNRTDIDPLWTGSAAAPGTNPDNWQIQVAARAAGGAWSAPVSLGADDHADRHPDIAFSAQGDLVVAWETKELSPAGKNLAIQTATSANGGMSFTTPAILAPSPLGMGERPRLGRDADGAVRAVWYDSRSADWRWRVMTAVWRKGAGWDAGRLINSKGQNTWPATAGGVVVFASTRGAARLQRDQTQQIYALPAG